MKRNFKEELTTEKYRKMVEKIEANCGISVLAEFPDDDDCRRLVNFLDKFNESGCGRIAFNREYMVPDEYFGYKVFPKKLSFLFVPPSGPRYAHTETFKGRFDEKLACEKAGLGTAWVPKEGYFEYNEEEEEWVLHSTPNEIVKFNKLDGNQFLFWDWGGEFYYPILVKDIRYHVKEVKDKEVQ